MDPGEEAKTIELTVKTLDSQNHAFTIDESMTVREFKQHIAESVDIPADSQRLIYCGRVLQDSKKINDYDVNGKVIHLVQRAPPQAGQRAQSSGSGQEQSGGSSSASQRPFRPQIHGNAMYLGSMSIPSEVLEGTGFSQATPQVNLHLPTRRFQLITRMLDKTHDVINHLQDPSVPIDNTPDPPLVSMPQQVHVQTVDYTGTNNRNSIPRVINNIRMATAVSSALNAAMRNNATPVQEEDNDGDDDNDCPESDLNSSTDSVNERQQAYSQEQREIQSRPRYNQRRIQPNFEHMMDRFAAQLERYLKTQRRLQPFIERYRHIISTDPPIIPGSGRNSTEDHQRVVDGVSRCLHYMAHAAHALSDIMVNMNQPPPRHLRCRPVVVQHSAIVQAGIPIQVEARINVPDMTSQSANNNNENQESESSNPDSAPRASYSAEPTSGSSSTPDEHSRRPDTPNVPPQQQPNVGQNPFSSIFTLPNNVVVMMEVSPEAATNSSSGEEQPQNNGATNNNVNSRVGGGGGPRLAPGANFPWSGITSPGFLQNIMQAVAGHVAQSGVTGIPMAYPVGPQIFPQQHPYANQSASGSAASNQSQSRRRSQYCRHSEQQQASPNASSQSQGAPHAQVPPRPQIFPQVNHLPPTSFGINERASADFDPFLLCNSHHLQVQIPRPPNVPTESNFASSQTSQSSQTSASTSENQDDTQREPSPESTRQGLLQLLLSQFLVNSGQRNNGNLRNVTIAQVLQQVSFLGQSTVTGESMIRDLGVIGTENLTFDSLLNLSCGNWTAIGQLRQPLREYFLQTFPDVFESSLVYNATNKLIEELKPYVENIFNFEEALQSRVNIVETVLNILKTGILRILNIIFQFDPDNVSTHEAFNNECKQAVNQLGEHLIIVLRHALGGQESLRSIVLRVVTEHVEILEETAPGMIWSFIYNTSLTRFHAFSSAIPQPPTSEIIPLLVFRPEQSAPAAQNNSDPEPMEVEATNTKEKEKEEVLIEDPELKTDDIPERFSGDNFLPPDWVPVIARDIDAQRRVFNDPLSDAYLSGLPSKRRKLIEQQKPRLIVSSPPPNTTPIVASLERLVKEGTTRAGVDEVAGAAAAVASDPGVRCAFGQAIKECLKPKEPSVDFPDPVRFPNATKYFADND